MKKNKTIKPASKEKKTGPGSNPVNKFKKGKSGTGENSVSSALDQTLARTGRGYGRGFDDTGTVVSYDQES